MLMFSLSYVALLRLRVVQLGAKHADKLELRIEFMDYSRL